jgi:hypothetical protein
LGIAHFFPLPHRVGIRKRRKVEMLNSFRAPGFPTSSFATSPNSWCDPIPRELTVTANPSQRFLDFDQKSAKNRIHVQR